MLLLGIVGSLGSPEPQRWNSVQRYFVRHIRFFVCDPASYPLSQRMHSPLSILNHSKRKSINEGRYPCLYMRPEFKYWLGSSKIFKSGYLLLVLLGLIEIWNVDCGLQQGYSLTHYVCMFLYKRTFQLENHWFNPNKFLIQKMYMCEFHNK